MGYHSDQALDLEQESYIALFSCYRDCEGANSRKLIIQSKDSEEELTEIPLFHNSAVVFSTDTNRRFKHKIILDRAAAPGNEWLGVTFRTSKTFVDYTENGVFFEDGVPLTVADEEQKKEFYKLRGMENRESEFSYPRLRYTISESDLMKPN